MPDRDLITEPDWTIVRRVEDETGSHIEPPFDEMWPDLWKLRWLAASVGAAIGTQIHVGEDVKRGGPYRFGISYRYSDINGTPVGVGTSQTRSFDGMWTYLTGMESGHRIAAGRIVELEDERDELGETVGRITDLFEAWAAEENEHRAAGELGIAEGLHVAIEALREAVHG